MRTYIVDAFTDTAFRGNPAGVCLTEAPLDDRTMLAIAQELGLSETAFVGSTPSAGRFELRYFSPKMEIPLCGHATLASARVLFDVEALSEVHFTTINKVSLVTRASRDSLEMVFPSYETVPAEAPPLLLSALGLSNVNNTAYNSETNILLLEISSAEELAHLAPDFEALYRSHDAIHGVLVTAPASSDSYDFHSRFFWPWSGTNEDPVTGGTHTFLTKYWSERLGKRRLRSYQSSKRSGHMEVELIGEKVHIRSQAVVVFEGRLCVVDAGLPS